MPHSCEANKRISTSMWVVTMVKPRNPGPTNSFLVVSSGLTTSGCGFCGSCGQCCFFTGNVAMKVIFLIFNEAEGHSMGTVL